MRKIILALASAILLSLPSWGQDVLWYTKPAQNWNEALPVGNGRLGAMDYGHVWYETIQLNEESLWAGCKTEADADAAQYIPEIQRLLLDGKIKEGRDLARAKLMGPVVGVRSYQSFGELKIQFNGMDDE
ncbi:MAG: glycoside hydrolase N-terminal domain-containing protein, partial [Bacteroidales bacterium]|nr:glycoside hydrolase N-terminal domain-containing protein [Bacteroidales bacterium]